jgi:alpha-beta hydrolase superfamily lysophospholipase
MPRARTVTPVLPTEIAARDGLAYSLWLPEGGAPVRGGVVILHGAGSCKESHHDYARIVVAAGFAAIAFDQRGHGASDGPMDGRVIEDISSIAALLRSRIGDPAAPLALRGSSMGGCFAILAAAPAGAAAVVSICPASPAGLRRGVAARSLRFEADVESLDAFLGEQDLHQAVAVLEIPLLLLHAEGDEQVPVDHSRELATRFRSPDSRLITVPGGHHRSVQHDEELQAISLRFVERVVG